MSQSARRRPTFEELYREIGRLPENLTGLILEPGVLTTMSRPGLAHECAAQSLLHHLARYNRRLGGAGWWILHEYETRFPGDRLAVPDVSGFRAERVAELPRENPMTVLPDWACEILSPTTARDDRLLKLPLYASSGVRWVWLVDPELRTVEVFESVGGRPSLVEAARDDTTARLPPFDDEAMSLGRLWLPPREASLSP